MRTIDPVCPIFGECGGCQYQDRTYPDELALKERQVREMLQTALGLACHVFRPIVASPRVYHYRSRLDLKLLRTRQQEIFVGFSPVGRNRVIEIDHCPIALESISAFIPKLKQQAADRLPSKYRNANLVVKTGDDRRVAWGGIGRRSLRMTEDDYLFTEINGRRIHYALDTFFQANLSILPRLFAVIDELDILHKQSVLYDLYGGVGLFSVGLYDRVARVVHVEENTHAIRLAEYNRVVHNLQRMQIVSGRMEDVFHDVKTQLLPSAIAIVDPPRQGLSPDVLEQLASTPWHTWMYLSCHPETLLRDLAVIVRRGWRVNHVIPLDFFPRTRHIETLVVLRPVTPPR